MNLFTLFSLELKKSRRTHIFFLFFLSLALLWLPSVLNSHRNFSDVSSLIPEDNFFIQGFLGFAWVLFPALLIVVTVMMNQLERGGRGLVKMLSLPVSPVLLCLAKFLLLLVFQALLILFMIGFYCLSAGIASCKEGYNFFLPASTVLKYSALLYLSALPMAAVYLLVSVAIQTPVFSMGIGLASVIPSVLIMNTKTYAAYPTCYPFYLLTQLMGAMQEGEKNFHLQLVPLLPAGLCITVLSLLAACFFFGRAEQK